MLLVVRSLLETLGVVGLTVAGVAVGRWCSRLRGRWWFIGYIAPLVLILFIGMARWYPRWEIVPPFAWIMAGRLEFALLALAAAILLMTPLSRLPQRRKRVAIVILLIVVVTQMSFIPFLAPAFNCRYLSGLKTMIDSHGVCLQSTDYTCGPAAAVTVLRQHGLEAEEGRIAVLARTTRFTGTPPDLLCMAVEKVSGLQGRFTYAPSLDHLRDKVPFIALVKYAFLIDHYVTVLEVRDDAVVIADPLIGRTELTRSEFDDRWRNSGIVFHDPVRNPCRGRP